MHLLSVRKLAQLLNTSVARLREIAAEVDNDVNSHYRFHSEKKPGSDKVRHYMVPTHELKEIHRKIKSNVLTLFPLSAVTHGGIRGRSPRSNASKHLGQRWLVTMDVKSFFPNVRHYIVHDMFLINPTIRALSRKRLPIWRKTAKYQSRPKFKVTPNSQRQEVTGLVVNATSGPSVPKRYRDGVRTAIFQLRNIADVEERRLAERSIRGRIAYVRTCNPGPAAKLTALLDQRCGVGVYGIQS